MTDGKILRSNVIIFFFLGSHRPFKPTLRYFLVFPCFSLSRVHIRTSYIFTYKTRCDPKKNEFARIDVNQPESRKEKVGSYKKISFSKRLLAKSTPSRSPKKLRARLVSTATVEFSDD